MLTLPDNADAATTLPPFSAVGPHPNGFFKDCQTIPTAEDFNELIVNLRALLTKAGVGPVKGDATMLWRAIQALMPILPTQKVYTIDSSVTLSVRPGGLPNPSNPLGGQPFDTLASAFAWLGYYSITSRGLVTINVADGTYTSSGPLNLYHADGARIVVAGTSYSTVLNFPSSGGLIVPGALAAITNLTVQGAKAGGSIGIEVTGSVLYMSNVLVTQFDANGIRVEDNGYLGFVYVVLSLINDSGLGLYNGGVANGSHLQTISTGQAGRAPWISAVEILGGGHAWITWIEVQGGWKGISVSGAGAELRVATLNVQNCAISAAVEANDGGAIINSGPGNAGDWLATNSGSPFYFWANVMGLIRADGAFHPSNKANCQPPANTTGWLGAWTITT